MKTFNQRGKYDDLTESEFSLGRIIIFVVYILIVFLNTFQRGMLQQLEYIYYKFNMNEYSITEAQAVKQSIYDAGLLRFDSLLEWKCTTLSYNVDGNEYCIDTYSYPEVKEQQYITIAVEKDNPQKIIRYIPYVLTMDDQLNYIFGWGPILIIFCYLCIIKYLIAKRKKRKDIYYAKEREREKTKEKEYTEDEIKLQNIILQKCDITFQQKEDFIKIDRAKEILDVEFHKDFMWCLQNLTDEKFQDLLLVECVNENYSFVNETLKIREYGLPINYYVIAKSGEHYLCGHACSARMYIFSENLGITNTQYENIYSYLMERLENNSIQ